MCSVSGFELKTLRPAPPLNNIVLKKFAQNEKRYEIFSFSPPRILQESPRKKSAVAFSLMQLSSDTAAETRLSLRMADAEAIARPYF